MKTTDIRTNQTDVPCDICGRTLPRGDGRGRSFIDRFRARRERAREVSDQRSDGEASGRRSGRDPYDRDRIEAESAAAPEPPPAPRRRERERDRDEDTGAYETPRRPRHVRAVPTNADLKMERALEVFNGSDHTRTVGGVARSLGAPEVSVRPLAERPSVVSITVMWELSWYRYEVDLSDEAGGVRKDGQGSELTELSDEEQEGNAAADDRG